MVVAAPVQSGSQSIFKTRYENFIGGKWVPPVKGKYSENLSPITGKSICQVPRSSAEDVELALDAAHAAKDKWGKTSPADRARVLHKIADRIEENLDRLAIAETWDNGKPIRETRLADIPLAIDHFRYFASCIRAQEGSIGELDETTVAYHFHEPLGVIGQIIPWNFPILMAAWKLAPYRLGKSYPTCLSQRGRKRVPILHPRRSIGGFDKLIFLLLEKGFPSMSLSLVAPTCRR